MDSKKINQLGTEVDPQQSDLTVIGDPISGQLKKITWLQVAHLIGAQASVTLQQVTDNGNTTNDPITTAGLTLTNLGTGLPRLTSGEFVGTYGYGLANGVATLDSGGKIPASQLPSSVMEYKGVWNASTNTPTLADGTGDNGDVYLVNVAGSQNLGSGTISFAVGDWVVYNGTIWQKSLNSNAVASVFGRTGTIVAQEGDYNIDQLGDVAITSAATNDYLRYNGSSWVNTQFPTFVSSDKLVLQVRNNSGATINKGTVVYINGAAAGYPTIAKAIANADSTSAQTLGLVQDNISNNSNGVVVLVGQITGIDTSAYAAGTQLYLSGTTAGAYTSTKTLAPTHLVYVGIVSTSNAVNGAIEVKIQNGYELDEIHDVAISSVADKNVLAYESSTSLWKNKSLSSILVAGDIPAGSNNYIQNNATATAQNAKFYIGTGNRIDNSTNTDGIFLANSGVGNGYRVANSSTGNGIVIDNSSGGTGLLVGNTSTGSGIVVDNSTAATGYLFRGAKNAVNKILMSDSGNITADSYNGVTATFTGNVSAQRYLVGSPTDNTRSFAASGNANDIALWLEEYTSTGSGTPDIFMRNGRGTVSSKASLQVGDSIGGIAWAGYVNNTSFQDSAALSTSVVNIDTTNNKADVDIIMAQSYNSATNSINFRLYANGGGLYIKGDITTDNNITINNGKYYYAKRNTGSAAIAVLGFASGSDTLSIKGGTSGGNASIQFLDTAGTVMTMYNSNVVIGDTSTTYKLDVNGSTNLRAALTGTSGTFTVNDAGTNTLVDVLTLEHTTSGTAASGIGAGIKFRSERASGGIVLNRAAIYGVAGTDVDDDGDMVFYTLTDTSGSGFSEKARLTSFGNFGIGVNPKNVYSDSRSIELGANGVIWSENTSSIYNSLSSGLNFYFDSAGTPKYKNSSIAVSRYTQYQGSHIWYYAASGTAGNTISFTTAMTLNSSGNLIIGNPTANGSKLQVDGVTQASSFYSEKGTQSTANTTWTTVYTIPQTTAAQGIYYVYAHYLDGVDGMAFIQILADRTYRRSINGSNGATVSVRLDGNNIQVYQSYGSTQNIDWSILIQKLL